MNILFLIYLKDKRSARQCPAAFLPSFSEFPLRIGSCAHICQSFTEKKKEHWVTSEKLLTQCNSVIILCAVSLKKNQECKISINSLEVMMVSFLSLPTLFFGKKKKKKKKENSSCDLPWFYVFASKNEDNPSACASSPCHAASEKLSKPILLTSALNLGPTIVVSSAWTNKP